MPAVAAIPAVAGVAAKTGTLAKLGAWLAALGKGTAATKGTALATGAGLPGLTGKALWSAGGTKMAASPAFKSGLGKALFGEASKGDIALRLAPDLFFGGVAGLQTPGDIGDKVIAGTTQALGGSFGGIGTSALARKMGAGQGVEFITDMAGSYGGDLAGFSIGEALMRGKDKLSGGEGLTPWENLNKEEQLKFANQIRNQTALAGSLLPGTQSYGTEALHNQYLADLGLA